MFSRFRRETAAVELYGKLPLAKDYLRVGGGEGSGLTFRDWVDHSFSPVQDSNHRPLLAWPGRFILAGHGDDPLMGCSWPSSDSGGLRPFPFMAFVRRRRRPLQAAWMAGGAGLRSGWDELAGIFTAHRSYGDGQSFLAAMRGRSISFPREPEAGPQPVDFEGWVQSCWPEGGVDELVTTLADLGRLGSQRWKGPIRLPLVAGLPQLPQVHAWWTALGELGLIDHGEVPSVLFPLDQEADEVPHFVTFLPQPLRTDHQPWLSPPGSRLGEGDHAPLAVRAIHSPPPPSESTPPLSESMKGPLISARARVQR